MFSFTQLVRDTITAEPGKVSKQALTVMASRSFTDVSVELLFSFDRMQDAKPSGQHSSTAYQIAHIDEIDGMFLDE